MKMKSLFRYMLAMIAGAVLLAIAIVWTQTNSFLFSHATGGLPWRPNYRMGQEIHTIVNSFPPDYATYLEVYVSDDDRLQNFFAEFEESAGGRFTPWQPGPIETVKSRQLEDYVAIENDYLWCELKDSPVDDVYLVLVCFPEWDMLIVDRTDF